MILWDLLPPRMATEWLDLEAAGFMVSRVAAHAAWPGGDTHVSHARRKVGIRVIECGTAH